MTDNICAIPSCKTVVTDKSISCSGTCNRIIHASCIKMNNAMLTVFNSSENLKWFCVDCCDVLAKLQRDMDDIKKLIVSLSNNFKEIGLDRHKPELRITRSSKKPLNTDTELPLPPPPSNDQAFHQQLNSVDPKGILGTCSKFEDSVKVAHERKYIYASKFSNTTSPEALRLFLSKKMDVPEDEIDCRLLVSSNQDVTRLNFVSFKIGVNQEIYSKFFQPDVWPMGVPVREFINRPKNSRNSDPVILE